MNGCTGPYLRNHSIFVGRAPGAPVNPANAAPELSASECQPCRPGRTAFEIRGIHRMPRLHPQALINPLQALFHPAAQTTGHRRELARFAATAGDGPNGPGAAAVAKEGNPVAIGADRRQGIN
jgi:hypothetical protein